MTTPPKAGGPYERNITTSQGVSKKYYYCCAKSGAPNGAGCDKWVRHQPKTCDPKIKRAQAAKAKTSKPRTPATSNDVVVDTTEITPDGIQMDFDFDSTDEDVKEAYSKLAIGDDSE